MTDKAYFELSAGAAGDMLLAAVLDVTRQLSPSKSGTAAWESWNKSIRGLLALEDGSRFELREIIRGGMAALKIDFFVGVTHADHYHATHEHESHHVHHHGRHLREIEKILAAQHASGAMSDAAAELSTRIFRILADSEARVHGTTPEKVHFHEVGAFDSIMDIAGFASAWTALGIAEVTASPATVGSGIVETQHGKLGVPPPAVVEILKAYDIPTSSVVLPGECLTPTGAACLAAIVKSWGPLPAFGRLLAQGAGAGTREIEGKPNVVRLIVGTTA